jgi:hypothetical protein
MELIRQLQLNTDIDLYSESFYETIYTSRIERSPADQNNL